MVLLSLQLIPSEFRRKTGQRMKSFHVNPCAVISRQLVRVEIIRCRPRLTNDQLVRSTFDFWGILKTS